MKKTILIILIIGLALFINNQLQNSHNRSIIKRPDSGKSRTIEGYVSVWNGASLTLFDLEDKEKTVTLSDQTVFLRVYVNENDNLLGQEKIGRDDLIKNQFIKVDVYQGDDFIQPEAIIVRQIIYAEK